MMDIRETVERDFKQTVCKEIVLMPEGQNRFQVLTPFRFDDGDHFAIVLKKSGDGWILSDEGHTFMQLSYRMDMKNLEKGSKAQIISNTVANFGITETEGVLTANIDLSDSGNIFYDYLQGLIKITDVTYLSRENVRSTFWPDFKEFMSSATPPDRIEFNYKIMDHDPDGMYPVDCRLNGMPKPLFIFAINNDAKCKDVTINLHQYENWNVDFNSISIFEDQEEISRRALARFSDVSGKQFSSLYSNKDRIQRFINAVVDNGFIN